ncbi:MAG: YihA family ribosome biogenesis GTP-binding protein [Bacteroidetes bacterium]|nr:YihA family ribosome biogenesis GTP-binding protein [Bacteroidota bacterium]
MKISEIKFLESCPNLSKCPKTDFPEFAIIGRSNVGKSSLINMLFNNKKLAKVSSTPGKTQLINYFVVNEKWYLVDLPGYGWAKVSKTKRAAWSKMIENYLLKRKNLYTVFVLIDCRLKPQKIDIDFINFLGINKIPITIIMTKIDKISEKELKKNIVIFKEELLITWESLPQFFLTSSVNKFGRDEILKYISSIIKIK